MQKKKKIFGKLVKKDYNDELEEILEHKNFDEYAKSTLLGILYKAEAPYKDMETVKRDVKTKEEYVAEIINIIKNNCNSIIIVNMGDEKTKIPGNRTYIVDKQNKTIMAYPIERKILYAISKISNKKQIVNVGEPLINETLTELINTGYNIDMVEPLRDFNGYSWTTIPNEIESIDHNLIYQCLRILVGHEFLDRWVKNDDIMLDYFYKFKEILEQKYGSQNKDKLVVLLIQISILLAIKFDRSKKVKAMEARERVKEEYAEVTDRTKFIENTTSKKIKITRKIKKLDEIINDKNLLQKEYVKRNDSLPPEEKIFSMRVLAKMLNEEKKKEMKKLHNLNKIMKPQDFIVYQKEIEEKNEYLKVLDAENYDEELEKLKIQFQYVFMDCLKFNIVGAETKQDIWKVGYDFRYYSLLQFDNQRKIDDVENLQESLNMTAYTIINKAIYLKALNKMSNSEDENYQILRNLFRVRIIKLEDAKMKITKEKGKRFVKIYDENEFEEKIEL